MTGSAAFLENRIVSADPVELIAILYEEAILSVRAARESLAEKDIAERSRKISRTIAIVSELDSSLNHSEGGQISTNFARLYQYIRERLSTANARQEDAPLAEVERLLGTLADAWNNIKRPDFPLAVSRHAAPEPQQPQFGTPFFLGTDYSQTSHSWNA